MTLLGASKKAEVIAEDKQEYTEHYYQSHYGAAGITARAYKKITYREIYPHIDWVLYIKEGKVEYDFVVRPGGDIARIRLKYGGATRLEQHRDGSITAQTPMGSITSHAPYSFQADGYKIASRYKLNRNILSFSAAPYSGTLTIDPVLEWGTYYGGRGADAFNFVTCDRQGNVYIAGNTDASNMVTTGGYQTTFGGGNNDAFLAKLNPAGQMIWATYYGGASADEGWGVSVDSSGNVYLLVGATQSTGLATSGSRQDTLGGSVDALLVKFDNTGQRQWATYYGGEALDRGYDVACDRSGNIIITGSTRSITGIATPGAYQATHTNNSGEDLFIAKFDGTGGLVWSTYYGGSVANGVQVPSGIAADMHGNILITGNVISSYGFATPGSHQPLFGGGSSITPTDAFVVKFDGSGGLAWATYYGGSGDEDGESVAVDEMGNVYLAGITTSQDSTVIATPGGFHPVSGGGQDVFLVKFDSTGHRLWGTYYGGTEDEYNVAIALNAFGNIYLSGQTTSTSDIATPGTYKDTLTGNYYNAFLVKFDTAGMRHWGTYYGSSSTPATANPLRDTRPRDVACSNYNVYMCGITTSDVGIATPGSFQDTFTGPVATLPFPPYRKQANTDGFLVKFNDCPFLTQPAAITGADTVCTGGMYTYTVPAVPGASSYNWTLPSGWSGGSTDTSITVTIGSSAGSYVLSVTAANVCDTTQTQTLAITAQASPHAVITAAGYELSVAGSFTAYQWYKDGQPVPGATDSSYTVDSNAVYSVKVTAATGCTDSTAYPVTNVSVAGTQYAVMGIYPNPAHTQIMIRTGSPLHDASVRIVNIVGRVMTERHGLTGSTLYCDIASYPSGVYIVEVREGENISRIKLLKE